MISEGKFTGLVDLDYISFGDCVDILGKIRASWYGTEFGDRYLGYFIEQRNLT